MDSDAGQGPLEVEFDHLLKHRSFVRRMARSLVRDEARAEDIEQETWLTALDNPPTHAGGLKGWLATVVRKLAWTANRGETRRSRRERVHAECEGGRPPATPPEVLERAAWSQRVVAAVMSLDEPYRGTVLLRYFEGLSSTEIARIHGVPAATVRTRLRRGLQQLRTRFDEDVEGGRQAWVPALAPLAFPVRHALLASSVSPATTSSTTITGTAGKLPWILTGAVATALLAVGAVHLATRDRDVAPRSPNRAAPRAAVAERADESHGIEGSDRPENPVDTGATGAKLEVTVLADGRPAAGARVELSPWETLPWRWRPGPVTRTAFTDEFGQALFLDEPAGYVTVAARRRGYARATETVFLPLDLQRPVVIELGVEHPVPVTVRELGSGAPLAGTAVGSERTDERGVAVLRSLAEGEKFRLEVEHDGYGAYGPRELVAGDPIEIELEPLRRTITWPVAGERRPPDGTSLTLRRLDEQRTRGARIEDGAIVAGGFCVGDVPELLAVLEDGAFARLRADGGPVTFAEPARLAVEVRDDRGAAVPGLVVQLHDVASGTAIWPPGRTGADGIARLSVYAADPVGIRLRAPGVTGSRRVGRFDPSEGEATREVVLPAGREVELRGRLDPPFALYLGRERLLPEGSTFVARPGHVGERVVRLHVLERGRQPLTVEIDCSLPEPLVIDVELRRAGTLLLPILLRDRHQPYQLELVDADDEEREIRRGPWRFRLYPGPDHVVREEMLSPGLYRVRDASSGKATPVFEVVAGARVEGLYLDLSDVGRREPEPVRGWVEAYADLDLSRAVVVAEGPEGEGRLTVEVACDGFFSFAWPGPGPWRLRAAHPALPATTGAEVTLTEPREDLLLQLTPWNRAYLRLEPAPGPARPGATAPRLLVFKGEERIASIGAVIDGTQLRFAGHREGRFDLWFDLPGFAPARLAQADLRRGTTDLGTLALDRGTTLRFRILRPEGDLPNDLLVSAQSLGAARYQRSLRIDSAANGESTGKLTGELTGLGRGAFRLTAWEPSIGRQVWSRRIEVEGDGTQDVEIDLR